MISLKQKIIPLNFLIMKQILKKLFAATLFGLFIHAAKAQAEPVTTVSWVSSKGYWIVEDNIHDPLHHIIRFYNNENELVHTEYLAGVQLDINRRKVKVK